MSQQPWNCFPSPQTWGDLGMGWQSLDKTKQPLPLHTSLCPAPATGVWGRTAPPGVEVPFCLQKQTSRAQRGWKLDGLYLSEVPLPSFSPFPPFHDFMNRA